jgi:hypothetical protein
VAGQGRTGGGACRPAKCAFVRQHLNLPACDQPRLAAVAVTMQRCAVSVPCCAADKYSGAGYMLYKGFNKMGKRMEGASATLGKQLNSAVGATPGQRCSLPVRMRDCSLQVCRCDCSLPVRLAVDSTSRLEWIMAAGSVCDCQ